jgi:hypothetical protein
MMLLYTNAINTMEGTHASTDRVTFSRFRLRPKTIYFMRRSVRTRTLQVADQGSSS